MVQELKVLFDINQTGSLIWIIASISAIVLLVLYNTLIMHSIKKTVGVVKREK